MDPLAKHCARQNLIIEWVRFFVKHSQVCVVCVPQEAAGNVGQTWAEGEDYSRKTLFVDLFQHDVMLLPLPGVLIITVLNEPLHPRIPH